MATFNLRSKYDHSKDVIGLKENQIKDKIKSFITDKNRYFVEIVFSEKNIIIEEINNIWDL